MDIASFGDMNTTARAIAHRLGLTALTLLAGVGAGCHAGVKAEAPVETSAYVEVGPSIDRVLAAPTVYYEDRRVFWFNGHWFFRSDGHWAYYETEPDGLREHR